MSSGLSWRRWIIQCRRTRTRHAAREVGIHVSDNVWQSLWWWPKFVWIWQDGYGWYLGRDIRHRGCVRMVEVSVLHRLLMEMLLVLLVLLVLMLLVVLLMLLVLLVW